MTRNRKMAVGARGDEAGAVGLLRGNGVDAPRERQRKTERSHHERKHTPEL